MEESVHVYEVRPRKDKRGFNLISDALPFDRLCMPGRTQSDAPSIAADHMMRRSAVDTKPHPTNMLPQSMKRLFH